MDAMGHRCASQGANAGECGVGTAHVHARGDNVDAAQAHASGHNVGSRCACVSGRNAGTACVCVSVGAMQAQPVRVSGCNVGTACACVSGRNVGTASVCVCVCVCQWVQCRHSLCVCACQWAQCGHSLCACQWVQCRHSLCVSVAAMQARPVCVSWGNAGTASVCVSVGAMQAQPVCVSGCKAGTAYVCQWGQCGHGQCVRVSGCNVGDLIGCGGRQVWETCACTAVALAVLAAPRSHQHMTNQTSRLPLLINTALQLRVCVIEPRTTQPSICLFKQCAGSAAAGWCIEHVHKDRPCGCSPAGGHGPHP